MNEKYTMRRSFSKTEKQTLFTESKGLCEECGIELPKNWAGDHYIPFSKNGKTELSNGQALCPDCNRKKSDKMPLREWQERFISKPYYEFTQGTKTFLLHAGVGSGKTIASIHAALEFLKQGFKIIICSPSDEVKRNWAKKFDLYKYDIDYNYSFRYNYKKEYAGISITYQSLNPENVSFLIKNHIVDLKTLIILDEVHHLGDRTSWGDNVQAIGDMAGFVLSLTGTPTRSNDTKIPFCTYETISEKECKLQVDFSYSYKDSVKDKICCPIRFVSQDVISEKSTDGYLLNNSEHRNVLYSALTVKDNSWVFDAVNKADKQLDELRERMPDAGGLIVCNSIDDAKALSDLLEGSTVITSDVNDSNDINRFANSNDKWIVTVKMVSEGVDIPRLRVIVYATNYITMLFFQQVAGRGVRNRDDEARGTIDYCFFYFPNYEPLVDNAKAIESEITHIVKEQAEDLKSILEKKESLNNEREIINVEIGDEQVFTNGIDMTWLLPVKSRMSPEAYFETERLLSEEQKKWQAAAGGSINPVMKADRIKIIKTKIHKIVARIAIKSGRRYNDIHKDLNDKINVRTTSNLNDENLLSKKLNHANEMLNALANGR